MKNHLVSNNNCNIGSLECPNVFLQGMKTSVWLTLSVDDTTWAVYN